MPTKTSKPKKEKSALRTGAVLVLFAPEEREMMREVAQDAGMGLSTWIRTVAIAKAKAIKAKLEST